MPSGARLEKLSSEKEKLSIQQEMNDQILMERQIKGRFEENLQGPHDMLDLRFDNTAEMLSLHFNEVIRRHHVLLARKNQQIEELQEALARCQTETQCEPKRTQDMNQISSEQLVGLVQDKSRNAKHILIKKEEEFNRIKHTTTGKMKTELQFSNKRCFGNTNSDMQGFRKMHRSLVNKELFRVTENPAIPDSKSFDMANKISIDKKYFGVINTTSNSSEDWCKKHSYLGNNYFGRLIIPDKKFFRHIQKPLIGNLCFGNAAKRLSNIIHVTHSDKRTMDRDYVRLRRTKSNVKLIKYPQYLTKINGLQYKTKLAPITSNEKIFEQRRRIREQFNVIADLEQLGHDFMRRLEFEERLDSLHWQIEVRTLTGGHSHQQEFKTLRHNLLEGLEELKRNSVTKEGQEEAQISNIPLQILYQTSRHLTFSSDIFGDSSND